MRVAPLCLGVALIGAACSVGATSESTSTAPNPVPSSTSTTTTTMTTSSSTSTTLPPATVVSSPGTFGEADLEIRLAFRSEVSDLSSEELAVVAMAILTDPTGWSRAGFTFVHDETSQLVVVVAEGSRVDALCLPLETFGTVSCQNGPVVAINADRWRSAWGGWDDTVESYRHYVITHEVGHLIGLRHPAEECPAGQPSAAAMDPQTRTTLTCPVNGVPLEWEVQWARKRPAVIGPTPEWEGPRPTWPTDG